MSNYIHFFWTGRKLSHEQCKNILNWENKLKGTDFKIFLWTTDLSSITPLKGKLISRNIKIYDFNKQLKMLFLENKHLHNDIKNLFNLIDKFISNKFYAPASDIIRVVVLFLFGGIYFDIDIKPALKHKFFKNMDSLSEELCIKDKKIYYMLKYHNGGEKNGSFIARKRSNVYYDIGILMLNSPIDIKNKLNKTEQSSLISFKEFEYHKNRDTYKELMDYLMSIDNSPPNWKEYCKKVNTGDFEGVYRKDIEEIKEMANYEGPMLNEYIQIRHEILNNIFEEYLGVYELHNIFGDFFKRKYLIELNRNETRLYNADTKKYYMKNKIKNNNLADTFKYIKKYYYHFYYHYYNTPLGQEPSSLYYLQADKEREYFDKNAIKIQNRYKEYKNNQLTKLIYDDD